MEERRKMKEDSSKEPPVMHYALRFTDLIQKQNVNPSIQQTLSILCARCCEADEYLSLWKQGVDQFSRESGYE